METLEREAAAMPAGTSLEILAPYLPYGIEVEIRPKFMPTGRGALAGLRLHPRQHRWLADVRYAGGQVNWPWPLIDLLPILRPFSQLCEPLADGTVPAVEVAKLAFFVPDHLDQQDFDWSKAVATVDEDDEGQEHLSVTVPEVGRRDLVSYCYLWTNGDVATHNAPHSNQLAIIDYLRRHHFAVGLKPHQYIPKSPAAATIQEGKSEPTSQNS